MKYNKILIFHGWSSDYNQSCSDILANKLESDGYEVTVDDSNYTEGDSVSNILSKYSDGEFDIVIGHSSGGFLALQYAQYHTIKRLILIVPSPSAKNFSNDFVKKMQEKLGQEGHEAFAKFHDEGIKHVVVNQNCEKIYFIFGKNDNLVTKQVADIYSKTYPKAKYIYLFAGHMGASDPSAAKILEIYDRLFPNNLS